MLQIIIEFLLTQNIPLIMDYYTRNEECYSYEIRFNPCDARLNHTRENTKNSENSKFQFKFRNFGCHFLAAITLLAILMLALTRNHNNDYHNSTAKDRDLQKKINTTKSGQSLTSIC